MARKYIPLTPDQIKQVETMAGLGLKVEQMAAILGVSKKTFERRMKDTPGAKDALQKGRVIPSLNVAQTAYRLATSGKVPAMTMFWLKCREGWSEKHGIEITGKDGGPVETKTTTDLTDEELRAKLEALRAKEKSE